MQTDDTDEAPPPGAEVAPPEPAPSDRNTARSISLLRKLLFSCLATLLFFGGLELGIRLLYPIVRSASLPNDMIRDHLEGSSLRYDPDLYWYWGRLPEPGPGINEFGFRREQKMSAVKAPGVLRAVALGDSQTLGAGVAPGETYSDFAERALGPGWEVLNAGISGYRSLNVYRLLQKRIAYFGPDVVIIDCVPFDSPRDDGPLQGGSLATWQQHLRALPFRSALFWHLSLLYQKFRPGRARWMDQPPNQAQPQWSMGNLDLILEWGAQNGVQVVLMEYAVWDADDQIGCHTREGDLPVGVPVVHTCAKLRETGLPVRTLFQDRNHLTVDGNRVAGEAVAETLAALELAHRRVPMN